MSSNAPALAFDSGALPNLPLQVKARTLLIMMASVPLCILAAVIDTYAFGGAARNYSMAHPAQVVWWIAILSTPHIIASLVTFADSEYLSHYKKPLIKGAAIGVVLGIGMPFFIGFLLMPASMDMSFVNIISFGSNAAIAMAAAYTTYHNLQQQYGISLMLMQERPTFIYHLWKWITIIPASLIFISMNFLHAGLTSEWWPKYLAIAAINLILAAIIAAVIIRNYLKKPAHSKIGLAYFCANGLMIAACFGLAAKGYILFAMLTPRLVHDLTSYWIYMVHDENRNATRMRNPIYALPKKLGLSPAIVCIPLSFLIGFALLKIGRAAFAVSFFVVTLNYLHYYIEGIIWKRGTPHRQHVPFI